MLSSETSSNSLFTILGDFLFIFFAPFATKCLIYPYAFDFLSYPREINPIDEVFTSPSDDDPSSEDDEL